MERVGIAALVPSIWKSMFLPRISQQISALVSLARTESLNHHVAAKEAGEEGI